ncbi:barren [Xylona heveae TC161]|uniref:Condensin complex subunit 2 n=1 Tax=Xylona heveae (strain CBS 132557 / TC161) TaxID=1328760 RepID=A0A165K108_XYLHT|nr:barren [Xylona heveae TC161]KZF26869.1 barren [Xylona heveae TC161]
MPRVTSQPRADGRSSSSSKRAPIATPQKQSPLKNIPLNDDRQEKAVRLQSRQALHDLQMNQLKAAASPVRRVQTNESPKTPGSNGRGRENDRDPELMVVGSEVLTPPKRMPILANFEEWMKMATDNKINANNSWNFALIDYFHDMSLLREGDGVNFQKASCTLDGCVKIYTSRVDSVATETGKLLSGLADSGNKKRKDAEEADGEDADGDEEDGEEGSGRKTRKRTQRTAEATLAPSFAPLQLKKFELEFSVDPLFKKASADFDEGGAKGLLLNHLTIDAKGRIVFDSSDDAGDAMAEEDARRKRTDTAEEDKEDEEEVEEVEEGRDGGLDNEEVGEPEAEPAEECEIDIASLGAKFFPDLGRLDDQDICPSLKNLDLGDPQGSLDIPFLKAPDDWRKEPDRMDDIGDRSGVFLDDEDPPGFDDDDGALGGFDIPADVGFGEGGEAWARDAAIEPQLRVHRMDRDPGSADNDDGAVGEFDAGNGEYVVSLGPAKGAADHEDILSYFDQALRSNWAGPEHWRIRKIKDNTKAAQTTTTRRKEKEPFQIDFMSPLDPSLAEAIYTPAASNTAISLPKTQWKSKSRNLLPDDKHFNSRQLLRLFLKPKARMGTRRPGSGSGAKAISSNEPPNGEMDEEFWARNNDAAGLGQSADADASTAAPAGNYDADFFQDDGLAFPGGIPEDDDDEDEFADAREHFSPGAEGAGINANGSVDGTGAPGAEAGLDGPFGQHLVTQSRRLRPEYMQYARVAKKVDVRRLKEELWKGIGLEEPIPTQQPEEPPTPKSSDGTADDDSELTKPAAPAVASEELKFTSVMNNLQTVYPAQAMKDISTSYCFICLLHLANEKGLVLSNDDGLEELSIRRDLNAEIIEGSI